MQGCFGLSGAVLVQLYYAAYGTKQQAFPLLIAWLVPTVCLMFMFVIRPLPAVETGNKKRWLDMFSGVLLVLGAYLLGTIILQSCLTLERSWKVIIFGGVVVILLCPMWVVVQSELELVSYSFEIDALLQKTHDNESCSEQNCGELEPAQEQTRLQEIRLQSSPGSLACRNSVKLDCCNAVDMTMSPRVQASTWPQRGDDFNMLQAALSIDFWLLFFISACAMGSALATINNMSQLGSSLDYTANEVSTLVSLWSIWDFSGRFGCGYISEFYLQSRGISRPLFMVISLAAMGVGHVIIAVAFPGALYVGPVFVGICFGAQWSLMPSISSELFGLKSFGLVYNTIAVACPLGSYVLSVKMLGYLYDLEAEKDLSLLNISQVKHQWWWYLLSSSSSCSGVHCFQLSFFIMAGVCMFGALLSTILFLRTRAFYRDLWLQFQISTHE